MRTLSTLIEYDDGGRAIALTDAEGGVTHTEYDGAGNIAATIDALGGRMEYRYDERNKLTETLYPDDTPADLETARLNRMTQVARTVFAKTPLRGDRTVEQAADILWTYSSPELYRMLILTRGWTPDRFGEFVGESLVDALLETSHRPTSGPPADENKPGPDS